MFNLFSNKQLTETEELVNKAINTLKSGRDGDEVYHPLYLAMRSYQKNPEQLLSIKDYGNYGMGFVIFLSYGTVSDIDEKQQLASIAYLFLSMAIEQNPTHLNYYKNRIMLMLDNNDAFEYIVSSVVNKDKGWMDINYRPFEARDALFKMEYSDLSVSNNLLVVDYFARAKRDLDNKIRTQFFGRSATQESIIEQGRKHHKEITLYLKEKVLENLDLYF